MEYWCGWSPWVLDNLCLLQQPHSNLLQLPVFVLEYAKHSYLIQVPKAPIEQTESTFKEKVGLKKCAKIKRKKKAKSQVKGGKGRDKSLSVSLNYSKRKEGGNKIGASTANLPNFKDELRKHVNCQCVKAST